MAAGAERATRSGHVLQLVLRVSAALVEERNVQVVVESRRQVRRKWKQAASVSISGMRGSVPGDVLAKPRRFTRSQRVDTLHGDSKDLCLALVLL